MLTPREQTKIANILNVLIDIPLIAEDLELVIIEHAVMMVDEVLEEVLPEAFANLLRNSDVGIDKDQARAFGNRLVETINQRVNLPYLNEVEEGKLLQTIVDPLVKGMIVGKKLDDLLPQVN